MIQMSLRWSVTCRANLTDRSVETKVFLDSPESILHTPTQKLLCLYFHRLTHRSRKKSFNPWPCIIAVVFSQTENCVIQILSLVEMFTLFTHLTTRYWDFQFFHFVNLELCQPRVLPMMELKKDSSQKSIKYGKRILHFCMILVSFKMSFDWLTILYYFSDYTCSWMAITYCSVVTRSDSGYRLSYSSSYSWNTHFGRTKPSYHSFRSVTRRRCRYWHHPIWCRKRYSIE